MNTQEYKELILRNRQERAKKPFLIKIFLILKDWFVKTYFVEMIIDKYHLLTRGYTECDIYNVNYFVINKVRKVLKAYVRYEERHGFSLPRDFESDPAGWLIVLQNIEFSFDHEWKEENDISYDPCKDMTEIEKEEFYNKVQKGFELFGKYLMDLWD